MLNLWRRYCHRKCRTLTALYSDGDDCRNNKLDVLPPLSICRYTISMPVMNAPLFMVGCNQGGGRTGYAVGLIDSRIKKAPYKDLFDFCHRIDLKKINKRTLEAS